MTSFKTLSTCLALLAGLSLCSTTWTAEKSSELTPLSLVVMDPLSAPLSCPCVEGYAQRKYEKLAAHLEASLGRPVNLVFSEALGKALKGDAKGRADIIIGKDSVVRSDAKQAGLTLTPVARLSDKTGSTTQTGLIVVAKADPAQKVADLAGYQVFFGPADSDEKHKAALALLRTAGVVVPGKLQTSPACSDGACKLLELGPEAKSAAVISSYAAPLLEGCGTIKKGDLRVVGKTRPVPFITAFATDSLSPAESEQIRKALLSVVEKPELCQALETLIGFLPPEAKAANAKKN